ncbi:hypothetical protein BHE74_00053408, partial [Ensete ventricosum]
DPPKTRSEPPSIVPEKSIAPYLEEEHTPREPDTLSSDSTDWLRVQLRCVNKRLDEVQKEVTKSKEEAGENSKHRSPFAPEIQDKSIPTSFRLPALESYDGSLDPTKHVTAFRAQMALYDSSLAKELEQNVLANGQPKPTTASLLSIAQRREESLAQFVNRFAIETRVIPNAHPSLVIQAFLMGIRPSKLFWSLVEKPPTIVPEMMQRANHFITAETPIAGKREEQKRPRTEQSRGPTSGPSRRRIEGSDFSRTRPPTTPLNSMRTEIFLQIRGKGLVAPPNRIKTRPEERDRGRYYRFHCEYDHDTEECQDLKNQIEDLIRQGHLDYYVQKRGDHPNRRSNRDRQSRLADLIER